MPTSPQSNLHGDLLTALLIQATGGKDMSSGGFAARAQSAGDRNPASSGGNNQQGGGNTSGKSDGQKK